MPDNTDDLIRDLREPLAYVLGLPSMAKGETLDDRIDRYVRLINRVDAHLNRHSDPDLAALRKLVEGDGAP